MEDEGGDVEIQVERTMKEAEKGKVALDRV